MVKPVWIPVEYSAVVRLPALPKGAVGWRIYSGETLMGELSAPPSTIRGRIANWWRWHRAGLPWR